MKTLEELKEEYINKFTEIVAVEGCQAFSDICNKKDDNGQFICEYCRRWGGQQREELRFSGNIDDVWQWIEELIKKEREEALVDYINQLEQQKIKEHKCEV